MKYDFIENETLRNYYEKEGVILTDEQRVWFIAQSHLPFDSRVSLLRNIGLEDVNNYVLSEIETYNAFKVLEDGFVYELRMVYDDLSYDSRIFDNFGLVSNYINENKCADYTLYEIYKVIVNPSHNIDNDKVCIFNSDGLFDKILPTMTINGLNIYDNFINIPFPFKCGDFVYIRDLDVYGICSLSDGNNDHTTLPNNLLDSRDVSILIDIYNDKSNTFETSLVPIIDLIIVDDVPEIIKLASELINNRCGIGDFIQVLKEGTYE